MILNIKLNVNITSTYITAPRIGRGWWRRSLLEPQPSFLDQPFKLVLTFAKIEMKPLFICYLLILSIFSASREAAQTTQRTPWFSQRRAGSEPGSLAGFEPGNLAGLQDCRFLEIGLILGFPAKSPATLYWTIGRLKKLSLWNLCVLRSVAASRTIWSETISGLSDQSYLVYLVWDYLIRSYLDYLVRNYRTSDLRLRLSDLSFMDPLLFLSKGDQSWPGCANICLFAVY